MRSRQQAIYYFKPHSEAEEREKVKMEAGLPIGSIERGLI
jgi:hypothetical protein